MLQGLDTSFVSPRAQTSHEILCPAPWMAISRGGRTWCENTVTRETVQVAPRWYDVEPIDQPIDNTSATDGIDNASLVEERATRDVCELDTEEGRSDVLFDRNETLVHTTTDDPTSAITFATACAIVDRDFEQDGTTQALFM